MNGGNTYEQSTYDAFSSADGAGMLVSGNDAGDARPAAYLNYILFDEKMNPYKFGHAQITGTANSHELVALNDVIADKAGFAYIYLSNESDSPLPVFFDDMNVVVTESNVVQKDDYYPFGLAFNSYQRVTAKENRFLYNGKEKIDALDLGWYDYGARMYMAEIGRWGVIDPLVRYMRRYTPYNYAYDNPIRYIDPDGMLTYDWKSEKYIDEDGNEVSHKNAMEQINKMTDPIKPKIISRKEWEAKDADKSKEYNKISGSLKANYNTIIVHHSGNADNSPTMNDVQDEHMGKEYADVGYHFGIDLKGNIYEGRPLDYEGAHAGDMKNAIGIVLLGDFDVKNSGLKGWRLAVEKRMGDTEPTSEMVESLVNLVRYLRSEYGIEYLGGHKEVMEERHCPGNVGLELVESMRRAFKFHNPGK